VYHERRGAKVKVKLFGEVSKNYVRSVKKKIVGPDRVACKGIGYRLNRRDRDHAQAGSGVHTVSCAIDKCIYVSSWESAAVDALFRFNCFLR